MASSVQRVSAALMLAAVLLGSLIAFADAGDSAPLAATRAATGAARALPLSVPAQRRTVIEGLDPRVHELRDGHFVSRLPGGRLAELTLDPGLQSRLEKFFARYAVPYAAAVAIEPSSGRVLAYVSHSSANPNAGDLARDPSPPAASVFKLVTASALVDNGVGAGTRVCYGGGSRRLDAQDLVDDSRRDSLCRTLEGAIGHSTNAVIAKLADRHLDAAKLERYAEAFGFGHTLPFDVPTQPSPREVPADRLERARMAAGFWHMHMSPLHAALIVSTIARGGSMPQAALVDRIIDRAGHVEYAHEPQRFRSVLPQATARVVGRMMQDTVKNGTSRKAFHDRAGRPLLPGIDVSGKTGTLSTESPYRAYSWWVGFAPSEEPTIALAILVVNQPLWHIKANQVAVDALRYWTVDRPSARPGTAAPDAPPPVPDEVLAAPEPSAAPELAAAAAPAVPDAPPAPDDELTPPSPARVVANPANPPAP